MSVIKEDTQATIPSQSNHCYIWYLEREFSQEVHGKYELKKSAEKCSISGQCNSGEIEITFESLFPYFYLLISINSIALGQYHASSIPKIDHDSHSQL